VAIGIVYPRVVAFDLPEGVIPIDSPRVRALVIEHNRKEGYETHGINRVEVYE
jgi:hypothetical protein